MKKCLLLILVSLSTSACSGAYQQQGLIKDHQQDYLGYENIEPLKTPPGIQMAEIKDYYAVPHRALDFNRHAPVSISPPGLKM